MKIGRKIEFYRSLSAVFSPSRVATRTAVTRSVCKSEVTTNLHFFSKQDVDNARLVKIFTFIADGKQTSINAHQWLSITD